MTVLILIKLMVIMMLYIAVNEVYIQLCKLCNTYLLLPTSQPLARRQRIVPREECCMQKNSRSAAESVSVSVRCKNVVPGFSQLQGRN